MSDDEPGVPTDEMYIAALIAKVGGLQQYEVVEIDNEGAFIGHQYDEVVHAEIAFARREAIATAPDSALAALVADLPAVPHSDPHWQDRVLDAIDQTEPVVQPDEPLRDVHSDDEPTHVGAVDDRFDNGGDS